MLKTDTKEHYKMYKSGKQMVNAMLLSALIATGGLALSQTAKADTVENATTQPLTTTVSSSTSTNKVISSPTADMNTGDSASTTQQGPNQTNTLNARGSRAPIQPRIYQQALVQNTNAANQVQNVQAQVKLDTSLSSGTTSVNTWATPTIDFEITGDQIANQSSIAVGKITTDSDNNGYKMSVYQNGATSTPVTKDGINYGTLHWANADRDPDGQTSTSVDITFQPNNILKDVVGLKHFTVVAPNVLNLNFYTNPKAFNTNGEINTHLVFVDPTGKTTQLSDIHLKVPAKLPNIEPIKPGQSLNPLSAFGFNSGLMRADTSLEAGASTVDEYNHFINNGFNLNDLHRPTWLRDAVRISAQGQTLTLAAPYAHSQTGILRVNVANDDGTISQENMELPANTFGYGVKLQNAGDNQTLQALEAQNFDGILFSRQNDGSYIVYTNVNTDNLMKQFDYNAMQDYIRKTSFQINFHNADPEKAIENTTNAIKHGLFIFDTDLNLLTSDQTEPAHLRIDRLNMQTGQPTGEFSGNSTTPVQLMASGQSAVKLHVINAQNGADLVPLDLLQCEAKG